MRKLTVLLILVVGLFLPNRVWALEIVISGNGADSDNEVQTTVTQETNVTQTNVMDVSSDVTIDANTGGNTAEGNSGDTTIETGDINISTNIQNSGNVGIVSLPCCPMSSNTGVVDVSGNGAGSENGVNLNWSNLNQVNVNNLANIENLIGGNLNTGFNRADDNLGGVIIETGSIKVNDVIKNDPLNFYLVLGGIISPDFIVKITGNLENSDNQVNLEIQERFLVFANNLANIENAISWDANTGGNSASGNLADVSIKTGDITLSSSVDNIVNDGQVIITCCEKEDKEENPPTPSNNPPTGGGGNGGGGGGNGGGAGAPAVLGAGAGQILPATGNFLTLLLTLLAAILFSLGLYLRLHPGQDPGRKFRIFAAY
jgi:hypothetical protein